MIKIKPKNKDEIEKMSQGGKILAEVKRALAKEIKVGHTPLDLEKQANDLIYSSGAEPSFKRVHGYHWATCINVNDGVVHGIPNERKFREGDIVSVDVGVYYRGFHTDSAFTVPISPVSGNTQEFLSTGELALKKSISKAVANGKISDISKTIQKVLESAGFSPSRDLTGHGVGEKLHEPPFIPCFWEDKTMQDYIIPSGATLAIEVIYCLGSPQIRISQEDGWTISTKDGKIAALFEETVAVTAGAPQVLTT